MNTDSLTCHHCELRFKQAFKSTVSFFVDTRLIEVSKRPICTGTLALLYKRWP